MKRTTCPTRPSFSFIPCTLRLVCLASHLVFLVSRSPRLSCILPLVSCIVRQASSTKSYKRAFRGASAPPATSLILPNLSSGPSRIPQHPRDSSLPQRPGATLPSSLGHPPPCQGSLRIPPPLLMIFALPLSSSLLLAVRLPLDVPDGWSVVGRCILQRAPLFLFCFCFVRVGMSLGYDERLRVVQYIYVDVYLFYLRTCM